MTAKYISRMKVKSFGPLSNLDIELTPLHAFIGPNDSGKSTLLRVVQTILDSILNKDVHAATNPWFSYSPHDVELFFSFVDIFYKETCRDDKVEERLIKDNKVIHSTQKPHVMHPMQLVMASNITDKAPPELTSFLFHGTRFIKWDPDAMRQESRLIPSNEKCDFLDERGQGLSGIYDAILKKGDDSYRNIADDVRKLFPIARNIQLENTTGNTVAIKIELHDGSVIPARFLSDGILYYLAFAALRFLKPVSVFLIEEPENGLHPARIKEIMKILRSVSESAQVILTTHSPLVINELQGNEVTVVTRHESKGTQAIRLDKTPGFLERSKVYALGELWVSYADGNYEDPLMTGSDSL
jgi:predicted ATPase